MVDIRSVACAVVFASLVSLASAQVTQRVSVSSSGSPVLGDTGFVSISSDARYVAFESYSPMLVPGDTNYETDVFVRDRLTGQTTRVSTDSAGVETLEGGFFPSISGNGRFVAFTSDAATLVPGDTNGKTDVFLKDRQTGETTRVSVDSAGVQGNGHSSGNWSPAISGEGRYVAFFSDSTNLVPGDTNGVEDVFVRDRTTGQTTRVSVDSGGAQGNGVSYYPTISSDGRYVVFLSGATNLVAGDTNGFGDVFVHDRTTAQTTRASVGTLGEQPDFHVDPHVWISDDGRYVSFETFASNLVPGDTNGMNDVFLRDRQTGQTTRVSVSSAGVQGDGNAGGHVLSDDGRYVAFQSIASNLVPGDTNSSCDQLLRDLVLSQTTRVNVNFAGPQSDGDPVFYAREPSISSDGRYVAFVSVADDLVPGDTGGYADVFLRDRFGAPSFSSLCHPGTAGVIACPCANPPGALGRGCDNSSSTGGALLTASGGTYLSSDSLVFSTSGEKPTALSIVAQWTGTNATGVVFGMGVRCTSGALKRLYTKTASGGSIKAPQIGWGDPSVSARSTSLGDPIFAGQSRWYLVYYRDAIVLGGCPASATFNATQTGEVVWSP